MSGKGVGEVVHREVLIVAVPVATDEGEDHEGEGEVDYQRDESGDEDDLRRDR